MTRYKLQAQLASELGPVEVDCIDCAKDEQARLDDAVQRASCVWVAGGNTFFLWHHMRRSGMDKLVKRRVEEGALYVGCSAGSIVAGEHISTAFWKGWDDPAVAPSDWEDAANLQAMGLAQGRVFFPHMEAGWAGLVAERRRGLVQTLVTLDESSAWTSGDDDAAPTGSDA